jgi:putative hydrolase of the HAD superfamily
MSETVLTLSQNSTYKFAIEFDFYLFIVKIGNVSYMPKTIPYEIYNISFSQDLPKFYLGERGFILLLLMQDSCLRWGLDKARLQQVVISHLEPAPLKIPSSTQSSRNMSFSPDKEAQLGESLRTKQWFGFDLDDTLHEFRNASGAATTHCLTIIANQYSIPLKDLQERYREVLKQETGNAFVDGKSSHDYRRHRLAATLGHFSLGHELIEQLLEDYEKVLVQNLKLKAGAKELLQAIKTSGRKIAIITEGPQDAQERAIRDLGVAQYVDFLATTNNFGVAKTSGLYTRVLEHLNIQPDDIVFVGDSMDRDIIPARAEGILAIHLDEKQERELLLDPPSIQALKMLNELL